MSIEGVIFESRGVDHEDDRRVLLTVFNGDIGDFVARQVKFALMKRDAVLGGHYHDYRELFFILEGSACFTLMDINKDMTEVYNLSRGDRLLIPPHVAHKVLVKANSVLVGCTEKPYISPVHNDHKYEF